MQVPFVFSILFFISFAIYLFFGLYIIRMNPTSNLHRMFLALCISLCFWSIGFAVANSAPDIETCLFWRRVSAIGWGSTYSLMLHFLLLLTTTVSSKLVKKFLPLLHVPALICVYVFSLSNQLAPAQHDLILTDSGWVNVSIGNAWTIFFRTYYISYVLACVILIWLWRKRDKDYTVRQQANILLFSILLVLILGSLTDVILSSALKGPLPQIAPMLTLLPVGAIHYCMKRFGLFQEISPSKEDLILSAETRSKLYFYLSMGFLTGGILTSASYFTPHMINASHNTNEMLWTGLLLSTMGLATFLLQFIKNEKLKEGSIIAIMLLSIPAIVLQFSEYAGITVWVFPVLLMTISLLFDTRIPLILITITTILTLIVLWFSCPLNGIAMDRFDHIIRIGIIIIAFGIGSFVNKAYIKRLRENIYQTNVQKLISDISSSFVSVNPDNIVHRIDEMLYKIGNFFTVDRAYIFLIEQENSTITYYNEWCSAGIDSVKNTIRNESINDYPWWKSKLEKEKVLYIEDVSKLPPEAIAERKHLTGQDVKSTILIPIEENNELFGFVGLDSVLSHMSWPSNQTDFLKILSHIIADGIIKVKSEKEIEHMAYYDSLTGLPNRSMFSDQLTNSIKEAKTKDQHLAVIFMDLDRFKLINDTMGHSIGDLLLKSVANGLALSLGDNNNNLAARFGGDEFLILINDIIDQNDIIKIIDNIMKLFERSFIVQGEEFFITSSAGVAIYPFDGEEAETLIKNADIAMYTAKAKGKNQYALCTHEMKDGINQNIKLSNSLYRALELNELTVYYQPLVKLQTGQITGLEALLRWNHPEMGMIPPSEFIPIAEMNGTINSIGDWVMQTAVTQNKTWQDQGFPHLRLAINVSVFQFTNPQFANNLDKLIKKTNINPQYIELEITESAATKKASHIVDTLVQLKNLGLSISIDDFGTEYSSLSRLKSLPIDRIKIDMQFIQGIEKSNKDRAITKVVINLAKSLGLEVLAEGVETAPQLDFLSQRLCDEVQGFYYYEPMPAHEIEKLFKKLGPNNMFIENFKL